MRGRHVTTGVTLVVLLGILALGAAYGAQALFAPIPDKEPAADAAGCVTQRIEKGQRISAGQVEVSVFNAGTRSGLADQTLLALTQRGFTEGDAGNAPDGTRVRRAQVWTTERNDVAARLVARQFGRGTPVRTVRTDLGPGVDVVVGDRLRRLPRARSSLVVTRASSACLPGDAAG